MDTTLGNLSCLPNDILIYILTKLPKSDLKQLRLTCKYLNNLIINFPNFKYGFLISINPFNLQDISDSIQNKELLFWNVQLENLCDSPQLASVMATVGAEVCCLKLNNVNIYETLSTTEMPNLRELTATSINVEKPQLSSTWSFASYLNLRELDLNCPRIATQFREYVLRQLMDTGNAMELQKLSSICNRLNEAMILEVLELHASTLRYLEIIFECGAPKEEYYKRWDQIFRKIHRLCTLKLSGAISAQRVETLVKALPQSVHLECIDLTGLVEVNNDFLGFIASRHGNSLRDVDLSYCTGITDHGLDQIGRATPLLKRLNLLYCRGISGLTHPYATLRDLSLHDLPKLSEDSICKMAQNIPNLVSLNLHGCIEGATDKSLAYIFRHQTGMRILNLFGCIKITDNGLMGLGEKSWPLPMSIRRLTGLNTLDLSRCRNLTDRSLINAFAFKELRHLNLTECAFLTSKGIESLAKNCPAIEYLNLSRCTMLTNEKVNGIAENFMRLRKIVLPFDLTPQVFEYFGYF